MTEIYVNGLWYISRMFVLQVAAERKSRLRRFGEATKEQAGDSVTVQQAEDIPFERVQKTRQTTEEKRAEKEDLRSALQGSDKSAVVGRCAVLLDHYRADHLGIAVSSCAQIATLLRLRPIPVH